MPHFWLGLVAGLLIGWLIEHSIDWGAWRSPALRRATASDAQPTPQFVPEVDQIATRKPDTDKDD